MGICKAKYCGFDQNILSFMILYNEILFRLILDNKC